MRRRYFRQRADAVRAIPLDLVLEQWGAERDRRDRARWHTERGPLSVTGERFFNWRRHEGGGGAIDLVMHLGEMSPLAAIEWLEFRLGTPSILPPSAAESNGNSPERPSSPNVRRRRVLSLPERCAAHRARVRQYLVERRCLSSRIVDSLMNEERLYADSRCNAVFLMVAGKPNRAVGAELRGTGPRVWRGMAPGSRKDRGYFWVGERRSKRIVICESAIDAMSCYQLIRGCICVSTAGVDPAPKWLGALLASDYEIACGFDDDPAGNEAARAMIALHPRVTRLAPPAKDWNDVLRAGK